MTSTPTLQAFIAPVHVPSAADCPVPGPKVINKTPQDAPKTVALTVDDGPSANWTPQVLDVLDRNHLHATFFLIGENVDADPAMVREILAHGDEIGNHTYTHPNLDKISLSRRAAEMDKTTDAIVRATGTYPCFFRGPGGSHHAPETLKLAHDRGMNVVGWDHDSEDWTAPDYLSPDFQSQTIVPDATLPVSDHAIVLMHDGSPGNYRQNSIDAMQQVIDFYRNNGYVFVDPLGRSMQ